MPVQPENSTLLYAIITIIVSFVTATVTTVVGKRLNKHVDDAKSDSDEGNAAEALSQSAKLQIETYTQSFIEPLRTKIAEKDMEIKALRAEMTRINNDNLAIRKELEGERQSREASEKLMREELRRADDALRYLVKSVRAVAAQEVDMALRIRSGEME